MKSITNKVGSEDDLEIARLELLASRRASLALARYDMLGYEGGGEERSGVRNHPAMGSKQRRDSNCVNLSLSTVCAPLVVLTLDLNHSDIRGLPDPNPPSP